MNTISAMFGKLWNVIGGRHFLKSVLVLVGGTALARAIALLVSPIITRLYTPEDFGVLSVFGSILSLAVVVGSMRYEMAIPLPSDERKAANLVSLSLCVLTLNALLMATALYFFGENLTAALNVAELKKYLWLLPISLFGAGIYQTLNYWALRKREFGRIAQTKLAQTIWQVGTQTLFGLFNIGALGLLIGDVIGRAGGSGTLIRLTLRNGGGAFFREHVTFDEMRAVASRYKSFPIYSSWSALLHSGLTMLPPLLIAALYGPVNAGFFSLGQRTISASLSVLGQSVAQVFFSEASKLAQENLDGLKALLTRTLLILTLVGLAPMALLGWLGPELFSIIFGPDWKVAGQFVQVLSLAFLAQFAVGPIFHTLSILEKQSWQLAWDCIGLVLVVIGLTGSRMLEWSAVQAVAVYGGTIVFVYVGLLIATYRAIWKAVGAHDK